MNERIRELMGKTLDDKFSHTWNTMSYEGLLQFSEKFAELIVAECMRMCDVAAIGYESHNHFEEANGCYSAKEYIEEHFGVDQ